MSFFVRKPWLMRRSNQKDLLSSIVLIVLLNRFMYALVLKIICEKYLFVVFDRPIFISFPLQSVSILYTLLNPHSNGLTSPTCIVRYKQGHLTQVFAKIGVK